MVLCASGVLAAAKLATPALATATSKPMMMQQIAAATEAQMASAAKAEKAAATVAAVAMSLSPRFGGSTKCTPVG